MSFEPILWALNDAPLRDPYERLVLAAMADQARDDGCNAYQSQKTLAERAMCSRQKVKRVIDDLAARGVIRRGDQRAAAHIRADWRPVVWDLMIPYSWWPNVQRVNRSAVSEGRAPLTPESRPDLAPVEPKPRRADHGIRRPDKRARSAAESPSSPVDNDPTGGVDNSPVPDESRGVYQTPREETPGHSDDDARGVYQTPRDGGSSSDATGGLPVIHGGSTRPPTLLKLYPGKETLPRARTREADPEPVDNSEPEPEPERREGEPSPNTNTQPPDSQHAVDESSPDAERSEQRGRALRFLGSVWCGKHDGWRDRATAAELERLADAVIDAGRAGIEHAELRDLLARCLDNVANLPRVWSNRIEERARAARTDVAAASEQRGAQPRELVGCAYCGAQRGEPMSWRRILTDRHDHDSPTVPCPGCNPAAPDFHGTATHYRASGRGVSA